MKYDLHCHTCCSRCSSVSPKELVDAAKKNKLDGIAVTDHNTIKGALVAKRYNKDPNFEVIVGSEIETEYGEILAYYLNENIKSTTFFEVIDKLKEQDAIISIAHPFSYLSIYALKCEIKKIKNKIHALECLNARNFARHNLKARLLARFSRLAKLAGSDSHFAFEVGQAFTEFKYDLRSAVKKRKTILRGKEFLAPLLNDGLSLLAMCRNFVYTNPLRDRILNSKLVDNKLVDKVKYPLKNHNHHRNYRL